MTERERANVRAAPYQQPLRPYIADARCVQCKGCVLTPLPCCMSVLPPSPASVCAGTSTWGTTALEIEPLGEISGTASVLPRVEN